MLTRVGEPEPFRCIRFRFGEHDDVVALRDRREVAVHNRGVREDALGRQPIEPVPEPRTAFRLDQFLVRRTVALALTAKAPLAEEESALVEQPRVLGQRDSLDDARAPERRCRHRNVGSDIGTLRQDDGNRCSFTLFGDALGTLVTSLTLGSLLASSDGLRAVRRRAAAALGRHDLVHQVQTLESVAGIADVALVHLLQIVLDVRTRQRGTTQQNRELFRDTARVEFLEVVLHDHCRLHEQSGHADDIGLVLDRSIENGRDGLLDAEVHDVVTVVTQDDVDKVLADIVDVALDRRNDEATLAVLVARFHVRLEERNCCLHDLGGLQNERQLHLSGTEQLADGLHARKQCLVDDFDRGLDRHRFGEIVVEAVALAVDDATLEPVEQRKSGEFLRT
ncbi:hypothetical protein B0E55_06393 [Rhodococcus sp. 66b]|nr:hypothetical protein B0E55_06393 [Rhodococcus sp. 66b]